MHTQTFRSELIDLLQRELSRHSELPLMGIKSRSSPASLDETASISEIIDQYQLLLTTNCPILIEKRLLDAFPLKEFQELEMIRYLPKIYRGLPRLYKCAHPSKSSIKKNFSHLPSLKRTLSEKAIFSLYGKYALPLDAKATLFTYVIGDGYGDFTAALETAENFQRQFPELDLIQIVLMPARMAISSFPEKCIVLRYETDDSPAIIPHSAMLELRLSDLILSLPTHYPHMDQLIEKLKGMSHALPMPKIESVGEYGYIESSWFHPRSGNRSLGLHFLEKGVFIHKNRIADFPEVSNRCLLQWMFDTDCPGPFEIDRYLSETRFFVAYLTTRIGGAVYLHALLKFLERDQKGIDLCVPDLGWFIQHVEMQNRLGLPVLEGNFGVGSLEVRFDGKTHTIALADKGKKVRLLCPGPLTQKDFRILLSLSGEFAAIRGNQSFSDAVSANKVFFFDGREHARYFVKDLIAIAENRIAQHKGTLSVFRGIAKAFLHNLPEQEGEWVEESFFQEKEEWQSIAQEIGLALQDPDTIAGFKKWNRIIADECSCNEFLSHVVQRAVCHQKHPEIERIEEEQISLFANQAQSFRSSVKEIQKVLNQYK